VHGAKVNKQWEHINAGEKNGSETGFSLKKVEWMMLLPSHTPPHTHNFHPHNPYDTGIKMDGRHLSAEGTSCGSVLTSAFVSPPSLPLLHPEIVPVSVGALLPAPTQHWPCPPVSSFAFAQSWLRWGPLILKLLCDWFCLSIVHQSSSLYVLLALPPPLPCALFIVPIQTCPRLTNPPRPSRTL